VFHPTLDGTAFEPPQVTRDYDGVAVVASPSAEAFRAAVWGISDQEWHAATGLSEVDRKKVEADELRVFSTNVCHFSFRCTQTLVHGGEPGQAAIIRFLCRQGGSSRQDFDTALARHEQTGKRAVDATASATRYVHNLLREPPPPNYPFDGVTETWFTTSEQATRAVAGDTFRPVVQDLTDFCDLARSVTMLCYVTYRWPRA
jgi:hypothetical protein